MKAEAKKAKQERKKAKKVAKLAFSKKEGEVKQPISSELQDYPEPKPSNIPVENTPMPTEAPKVLTSTINEASEAKITKLMEVFMLKPE